VLKKDISSEGNMASTFKNETYVLGREIMIYQLPTNTRGNWYCRFKNPSGRTTYVRKSLKTSDLGLATQKAINLYNDMNAKIRLGAGVVETNWAMIFDLFIEDLSPRRQQLARDYNRRYWSPFFGDLKRFPDLYQINDEDLKSFWSWRLNYWERNETTRSASKEKYKTSMNSLRLEGYALKHFLVKAFHRNYIGSLPEIIFQNKNHAKVTNLPVKNRRGRFDQESAQIMRHWWSDTHKKLVRSRDGFTVKQASKDSRPKEERWKFKKDERIIFNHPFNRYNTALTYAITITASNTGLRPVEIVKLKWQDLELWPDPDDGTEYTMIQVSDEVSKVKKQRDVIARDYRETYDRLIMFQYEWERYFGRPVDPEDFIFASSGSKLKGEAATRPCAPHQSIRNLLMKLGIYTQTVKGVEVPRTLYSFRAMFITEALARSMDIYTLARACGTSIEMIQKHYDYNQNLAFRKDITRHMKYLKMAGGPVE
jgi:integrase